MKIKTQLTRLLVATVLIFLSIGVIWIYCTDRHIEAMQLDMYITDLRLNSERTHRGVNDILLTAGTPESIAIAQESCNEVKRRLVWLENQGSVNGELRSITDSWDKISRQLIPFFIENNPDLNSAEMLILYGKILTNFDTLMVRTEKYNNITHAKTEKTLRVVRYLSIVTMLVAALWIYYIHLKLAHQISTPLTRLSTILKQYGNLPWRDNSKEMDQQRLIYNEAHCSSTKPQPG